MGTYTKNLIFILFYFRVSKRTLERYRRCSKFKNHHLVLSHVTRLLSHYSLTYIISNKTAVLVNLVGIFPSMWLDFVDIILKT